MQYPPYLFRVVVPFLNSCCMLRVGIAAEKQLLLGGMCGQKGYGQEQQVAMACGVHQQRVHMVRLSVMVGHNIRICLIHTRTCACILQIADE